MRRLAALLTVLLGFAAITAPSANAGDPNQIPVQETGIVDWVQDGDTFRFIETGQDAKVSVRMLGINTPEVAGFNNSHFPFDFCGGIAAQSKLKELLPKGTRVQMHSISKASSNRGRILRSVFKYNEVTGQYDIDVQAEMLKAGLAMWFTLKDEPAYSAEYRALTDEAQARQIGIWNPGLCGPIDQPDTRVTLSVVWDAPSNDALNLNGEYVIVRNTGASSVDLTGWLLRDSSLEAWYHFPNGSILAPNDYRVVHVGGGQNGSPQPRDLYMNSTVPIFPNVTSGPLVGDGAYLLDTNTAYRAWMEYPCTSDCSDPLQGKVKITKVNPRAPANRPNGEYIVIQNVSRASVTMDGYFIRRKDSTYTLLPDTTIKPGKSLTVRLGKGTPTATTQYWGLTRTLLTDAKDSVELRSPRNVLISRKSWG